MTQVNGHDEVIITREPPEDTTPKPATAVEEIHHYHDENSYYANDAPIYTFPLGKVYRIIWFIAIVLEILIGFRVFLRLIAANPQSGFASFIYNITAPFLAPFAGLTSTPSANGAALEISSIIAMGVYAILFWLTIYVIRLIWGR